MGLPGACAVIEGIDAAWGRPTPAQLAAAGKHFIIGYVSHDPAKNLSAAECTAYLDAGIAPGLVWETVADRALAGPDAGLVDGREARRQARALGFPDDRPIFTAVDFQATGVQLAGPVRAYLSAFAFGVGGTALAGVYGGLATVAYALDHGLVAWGWQTYAWSGGVWDPRAQVRQYRNGVRIAGHDTDLDRAVDLSPFWTRENTDMAITDADAQKIASTLLGTKLGKGDTTVGMALQTEIANTVIDKLMADLPAAVVALPPAVTGALTTEDLAAIGGVVHTELGKLSLIQSS